MADVTGIFTDGKAYERMMGRWSRLVGAEFLEWLALPEARRWLDVGCGNGAFSEEIFTRRAPEAVVGIDPSPEQVAYARTRLSASIAEFREADAQALPFDDATFDVAVMALVIGFVPDPGKAIAEMARVVKSGGCIAAYMWDFESGGAPVQPMIAALEASNVPLVLPPNRAISRFDALTTLWQKAGLVSIASRPIRIRVEFSDFDEFWDANSLPVGPQGKAIEQLSPAKRERLREYLRETLPMEADGRIAYEAVANAIQGRVPAAVRA